MAIWINVPGLNIKHVLIVSLYHDFSFCNSKWTLSVTRRDRESPIWKSIHLRGKVDDRQDRNSSRLRVSPCHQCQPPKVKGYPIWKQLCSTCETRRYKVGKKASTVKVPFTRGLKQSKSLHIQMFQMSSPLETWQWHISVVSVWLELCCNAKARWYNATSPRIELT